MQLEDGVPWFVRSKMQAGNGVSLLGTTESPAWLPVK